MFDLITIACKFLSDEDLRQILQEKIEKDIAYGDLEVLVLIGLNSEKAFHLLQNYLDRTGDLQTCAYVASFATTAAYQSDIAEAMQNNRQVTSKVTNERIAPYKRFIQAYRDYLNNQ